MAKRARQKNSKTELIRQYIEEHPEESARSVAKLLNASPALVYRVKGKTTGSVGGGRGSRRKSSGYDGVIVAARLIATCGSFQGAQDALSAAAEISRLVK